MISPSLLAERALTVGQCQVVIDGADVRADENDKRIE
jgi:hypothetical protein